MDENLSLLEQIKELLEKKSFLTLKRTLQSLNPADIAEIIHELPQEERVVLFRLLRKDVAIEVFEFMEFEAQQAFLLTFPEAKVRELIEEMEPDDRTELLEELPAKVTKRLLLLLSPQEKEATAILLGYQENSAGRMMTPKFMDLKENVTVSQALNRIRKIGLKKETSYYCYVIDEQRTLKGVVSLRDMVTADPDECISNIMFKEVISVNTDDDQEEVASVMQKYNFIALPVVDREKRLVGIITVDDIVDVVQEEATEDIYKMGAVGVIEEGYFRSNVLSVATKRMMWLLILLGINTITSRIIIGYEHVISQVVILSAFIPLLIGSGGNIGTQSSTVVIRSLALKEIKTKDAFWVVSKEILTGLLIGLLMGSAAFIWSFILERNLMLSLTVGMSLLVISTIATTTGTILPFIFKSLGVDPALTSSPFITSVVDILGVIVYLSIAAYILLI
ncbi:MAG: Magnesium transporter MgtE [candidate division WS2 bacterium]|uniref:Magnesium transporter MgtE n=1 Tax=Psychracetigena formicireducens TaxID=2986056 RepID=A0A9E2F575_PSYF1|nr:Magnesium transporter MgtE [Candidatus Psychracetigena formicireducens]